jgi:hypothetical protein
MAAQVDDTSKSPMWCAMKLARGLKMVTSLPRSLHLGAAGSAFDALAQFVVADLQVGRLAASWRRVGLMPAIWALRQVSSALGAVV